MHSFKTPPNILKKIEKCREKKAKVLDLSNSEDILGSINLNKIKLPIIPPEVFELTHIEELNLRNHAIQVLPEKIKQFPNLKKINLCDNPLREVADIQGLFLHYADVKKLNIPYENVRGLKLTLFSHHPPEDIFNFPNLSHIETRNHRLQQPLEWLSQLTQLTSLDLSNNELSSLSGLENLSNLSSLDLRNNQLSSLEGLGQLSNLSYLDLRNNQLSSLEGLEQLSNLSSLDLGFNQLSSLEGLGQLSNLSSLDLDNNQLSNIFRRLSNSNIKNLRQLHNLSLLRLGGNRLSNIKNLGQISNLSYLSLRQNQLSSLDDLGQLSNLSSLNVSWNKLSSLKGLGQLSNLSSLNVSWNKLSSLEGLGQLSNLSFLYLKGNKLSSLKGLGQLSNLSSLDLEDNQLSSLEGLGQLSNLSSLNLEDNRLSSLEGLGQLSNLSYLNLSWNKLSSLEGLGKLSNLSYLDLGWNQLSNLEGLGQLSNLSYLNLTRAQLSSLEGLGQFSNLSSLDLRENQLSSLEGLGQLNNLSSLYLRENQLSSLEGLGQLSNLSSLDLEGNQLSSLEGLGLLSNLSSLDLRENQLSSLEGLGQLSNLSYLNFRKNKLTHLPNELFNLAKLEQLDVDNNPITFPLVEQLELRRGIINLFRTRNYLYQLQETETCQLYEAKLLILGEGAAGKTTLANKILNSNYQLPDKGIESTEGIDVHTWTFPIHEEQNYQVNIWDFGGQEIYHATHQFFLSKRSLYLLVADNRKEDTDFHYWLNIAELLGEKSPILIIKNEKDNREWDIGEQILKGQFNCIEGIYTTNLHTKSKQFSHLIDALPLYLKQLPHIGMKLPKTWLTIRNSLKEDPRNYIDLKEFLALCEQHGFKTKGDKLQLSDTLHDLGTILHFRSNPLLNKTLFLKPHWATQAVYHVLDNKAVKKNFGQFTKQDLEKIWYEPEYEEMHDELLELMLSFKLCYPLTHCAETYIAPQLLSKDKADYQWQHDKSVTVLYKNYKFMPKGLITQLIVALHTYITDQQRCVWRSGMVLEDHNTYAEVIENYNAREIKITVAGENCRNFMTIIMHELKTIHDSYNNELEYDVLIPCQNCGALEFKYIVLQRYAQKFKSIECRECEQENDAQLLINGIHNPHLSDNKHQSNGKTVNVIFEGDQHMSESKTTHFHGSIHGTVMPGDNATHGDTIVHHNETHNTQNQGIQADLKSLSELLLKIDLGEQRPKVEKLLKTAETELKADTPDKEEIGSSLERAIKIAKKTGQLSDEIIPIGKKIGEYLAEYGETIIDTLSQIPA